MESIIIINFTPSEKILAPKPRRLVHKKKNLKRKNISKKAFIRQLDVLDDLKNEKEKEINLDSISFDEIKEDFKVLDEKLEEKICYDELNIILSSSSEGSSLDIKDKKNNKIKRPKRPIERNVLF